MDGLVRMPDLEGADDITLATWLKGPGERVAAGEAIAEASTDKVNAEIEAPVAGTVAEHLVEAGAKVVAGQPIARLAPDGG